MPTERQSLHSTVAHCTGRLSSPCLFSLQGCGSYRLVACFCWLMSRTAASASTYPHPQYVPVVAAAAAAAATVLLLLLLLLLRLSGDLWSHQEGKAQVPCDRGGEGCSRACVELGGGQRQSHGSGVEVGGVWWVHVGDWVGYFSRGKLRLAVANDKVEVVSHSAVGSRWPGTV